MDAPGHRTSSERRGRTSPNPPVGALIVKQGEVLAEGYHKKAGGPHAEIEAIKIAGKKAKGATLVVTLEPCCHFGKTPPCTDAIIEAGIRKVLIGARDPNPKVSGRGISKLKKWDQGRGMDFKERNVASDSTFFKIC